MKRSVIGNPLAIPNLLQIRDKLLQRRKKRRSDCYFWLTVHVSIQKSGHLLTVFRFCTYTKKAGLHCCCSALQALELPFHLNKQHRSPRRYVRTHTHPYGAYGDGYTYPEDIKMLQCLGMILWICEILRSQAQSAFWRLIMSATTPPERHNPKAWANYGCKDTIIFGEMQEKSHFSAIFLV